MLFFFWRSASVLLLGAILAALAACQGGEEVTGTPPPSAAEAPAATPTPCPAPLTVDLNTFEVFFSQGEAITLALTVTACEPITLYYRTSQRYDFVVTAADGQEVWRWSRDRTFLQVLEEVALEAGQAVDYIEEWDQRDNAGNQVPPGDYQVVAESSHCDQNYENCGLATAPRTIRISAP